MKGTKIIDRTLPWTRTTKWAWPEHDEKLLGVFTQVADIEEVMQHVPGRGVCVQAGGAAGVWALRFAQLFETVYTFEPHPTNFRCLTMNVLEAAPGKIFAFNAALGNHHRLVEMWLMEHEANNHGAFHVSKVGLEPKGARIPTMRIDDLALARCDLIYLDIEGFELQALQGGWDTIAKYKPVIAVEDKELSQHFGYSKGDIEKILNLNFGYEVVLRQHRDVVMRVPA